MFKRGVVLAGALAVMLVAPMLAEAAERECDRWLKLVQHEVAERKEALGKKRGPERAKIEANLASAAPKITEARAACSAGKDRAATLMALDLWDAFVEDERREGVLSLNSRLTILALRVDRLKAFYQRNWRPALSVDEERQFLAELDRMDGLLAETMKRALR
jgi:hypothetical protein